LETVDAAVALIVLAAVLSTLISASVGVASLFLGHSVPVAKLATTWRAWVGDMVGVLLIAPVILVWSNAPRTPFLHRRRETIGMGVTVLVVSVMVFFRGSGFPGLASPFHELYVLLAVLIWAALRFGPRGAATVACSVSAIAVAGTILRHGPFAQADLSESLFSGADVHGDRRIDLSRPRGDDGGTGQRPERGS
jgi:integral membrane sensor domain MASE1